MADFIQSSQSKNAVREFAAPIASVAAFNLIVQSVITDNPFACVSYMTAGQTHDPVEKTYENYTAKMVYEDGNAATVGNASHKFNTIAGYNAGITALLAAEDVTTAHAGTATHDAENDTFSATLRCHDANGELYSLNFSRTQGHPQFIRGRSHPDCGRDLGRYCPGPRVITPDETTRRGGDLPVPSLFWSFRLFFGGLLWTLKYQG